MLVSTKRAREKILLYGGFGSGKTYAALSVAKWAQKTGSDSHFYCLDTDDAIERMLDDPSFSDLENLDVHPATEWEDYLSFLKVAKAAKRRDWIIVDLFCKAWAAIQDHYIDQVFGSAESFFIQAQAEMQARIDKAKDLKLKKKLENLAQSSPLDGWRDWGTINRAYRYFTDRLFKATKANLICCAKGKALGDKESDGIRDLYGEFALKPAGQKDSGHDFHTVLFLKRTKTGLYQLSTAKDRSRTSLTAAKNKDLVKSYLLKVGGWEL